MWDNSGHSSHPARDTEGDDTGWDAAGASASADRHHWVGAENVSAASILEQASSALGPLLRYSTQKGKNRPEHVDTPLRAVLQALTTYVGDGLRPSLTNTAESGPSERVTKAASPSPPGEGVLEVEIGRFKERSKSARTPNHAVVSRTQVDNREIIFERGSDECRVLYQLLSLVVQLQLRIALPSSMHPPPPDFITAYDYPSRLHAPLAPYLTALAKTIRDRLQQDGRLRVQEAPSDDETVRSERDEEKRESDWGQAAGIACLYLVAALTAHRHKARKAWESLHSHELSGVREADDLCRLALEKCQACLPPSRGSVSATRSIVAESKSPGHLPLSELAQEDLSSKSPTLNRTASFFSIAFSMFSMRSRILADSSTWKSTSSLPQLAEVKATATGSAEYWATHVSASGMAESGRTEFSRSGLSQRGTPAMRSLRFCEAANSGILRAQGRYGDGIKRPSRKGSRPRLPFPTSWLTFGKNAGDTRSATAWQTQEELVEDDGIEADTDATSPPESEAAMSTARLIPSIQTTEQGPREHTPTSLHMIGRLASTPRAPPPQAGHRRGSVIGTIDESLTRAQSSPGLPALLSTSAATLRAGEAGRNDRRKSHATVRLPTSRSSPQLHPAGRAFENDVPLPPIDAAFQRKEDLSVFTRANACAVCGTEGVNFPSCRKCGITFCSRECRIGVTGAGDGKRHVCGIWEARRLLKPPVASHLTPKQVLGVA